MIGKELIKVIRFQYALNWCGIHGVSHWLRVRENGLRLAAETGANPAVVELFAFLHDSKRENDGHDPFHGKQAAEFAKTLYGTLITIDKPDFERLLWACEAHTYGNCDDDITVATCWDADRLDLGRVGITPDPFRLCTAPAKNQEIIDWAYQRSTKWLDRYSLPSEVDLSDEWSAYEKDS